MILTIDTLKVAVRKKDIAYPVTPADHWFFPFMHTDRSNVEPGTAPAEPTFGDQSVGMAATRAQRTIFKRSEVVCIL